MTHFGVTSLERFPLQIRDSNATARRVLPLSCQFSRWLFCTYLPYAAQNVRGDAFGRLLERLKGLFLQIERPLLALPLCRPLNIQGLILNYMANFSVDLLGRYVWVNFMHPWSAETNDEFGERNSPTSVFYNIIIRNGISF